MTSPPIFVLIIITISFPSIAMSLSFQMLKLGNMKAGPESLTFDSFNRGPYTGVADGRIVKYDNSTNTFVDFAVTTPTRAPCNGNNNPLLSLGAICGRTLGLDFYRQTNQLFLADSYRGLYVVGINGGLATLIANSAQGLPFRFLNHLVVDQSNGDVYFTDFSAIFSQRFFPVSVILNDRTGRLLKYSPETRNVTVLQSGLAGANGVAVNSNSSYLLVAEYITKRVLRHWLVGPRASQSEVVATFEGRPDNIRKSNSGDDFWVVLNQPNPEQPPGVLVPTAVKITGDGRVLRNVSLGQYYTANSMVSEFYETNDNFFVGSLLEDFVGVLRKV